MTCSKQLKPGPLCQIMKNNDDNNEELNFEEVGGKDLGCFGQPHLALKQHDSSTESNHPVSGEGIYIKSSWMSE